MLISDKTENKNKSKSTAEETPQMEDIAVQLTAQSFTETPVHKQFDMSSYFAVKKQSTLQEISAEMSKLLNNLDDLNVYLKDSVSLGEQFKNISSLWNTFYNFEEQVQKLQQAGLAEGKPALGKEAKQMKAANDGGGATNENEDQNQNQIEAAENGQESTEKQGPSVGDEGKQK